MVKNKLNNRGYMLVEIILASAIAFTVVYFIMNLTIKLKNKNDDMLIETMMATDKAIVNNKLMNKAVQLNTNFDCNVLKIDNNKLKYNSEVLNVFNEYASIPNITCTKNANELTVYIKLNVKQIPDKNFDILFNYKL